jgi:hypothetical protein
MERVTFPGFDVWIVTEIQIQIFASFGEFFFFLIFASHSLEGSRMLKK